MDVTNDQIANKFAPTGWFVSGRSGFSRDYFIRLNQRYPDPAKQHDTKQTELP
jgi:hypothetical protein